MSDSEHTRATLEYAIALLGGIAAAVAHFGFRARQLEELVRGRSPIPADLFLAAADVVLSATPEQIHRTQERMRRTPTEVNSEGLKKFLAREATRYEQRKPRHGKNDRSGSSNPDQD